MLEDMHKKIIHLQPDTVVLQVRLGRGSQNPLYDNARSMWARLKMHLSIYVQDCGGAPWIGWCSIPHHATQLVHVVYAFKCY